jgi:hypothetical protein
VLILPFAVVLGLIVGSAAGGSWRPLVDTRFWRPSLVLAAIASQAALTLPGLRDWSADVRFAIVVVTYLILGWWLVENARRSPNGVRLGFGIIASGWLLNLLAIVPNGGMPVSKSALARAGIASSTSVIRGHLAKHVSINDGTVLRVLGDTIPLRWFRSVVSPGDVLIAVGIGVLVAAAMKAPKADDGPLVLAALAHSKGGD